MNIKKQTPTIRSYGTPSIFNGANLWIVKNGNWIYIDHNGGEHDSGLSAEAGSIYEAIDSPNLFKGKQSFQKNLDLLNTRINTIHKELSYWDLYRISHTITNADAFPSTISSLAVGNSAVINCDTFKYNNQTYHRGDVVVKISDSNEILVPALNTGVYKPYDIKPAPGGGNNYILHYQYTDQPELEPELPIGSFTINPEGNAIYGQTYIFNPSNEETFSEQLTPIYYPNSSDPDRQIVKPIIKTFISADIGLEEIVFDTDDFTVTFAGNKWSMQLVNFPTLQAIREFFIQVK